MVIKNKFRSETYIKLKIKAYARTSGWKIYNILKTNPTGFPDNIFIRNSIIIFVEFKREKINNIVTQLNPHQHKIKNDIEKENCLYYVISSIPDGIEMLKQYDAR